MILIFPLTILFGHSGLLLKPNRKDVLLSSFFIFISMLIAIA